MESLHIDNCVLNTIFMRCCWTLACTFSIHTLLMFNLLNTPIDLLGRANAQLHASPIYYTYRFVPFASAPVGLFWCLPFLNHVFQALSSDRIHAARWFSCLSTFCALVAIQRIQFSRKWYNQAQFTRKSMIKLGDRRTLCVCFFFLRKFSSQFILTANVMWMTHVRTTENYSNRNITPLAAFSLAANTFDTSGSTDWHFNFAFGRLASATFVRGFILVATDGASNDNWPILSVFSINFVFFFKPNGNMDSILLSWVSLWTTI